MTFFLIQIIFFILASILCFTIPGLLLVKKFEEKLTFWEMLFLSTFLGFIFFTLLSYALLSLRLDILLIPIIIIIDVFTLKPIISLLTSRHHLSHPSYILLLVLCLGIMGQLAIISPSGLFQNGDLIFYSAHGHDGHWHIALMEEIKKGLPLQNPIYAGERLVNYHFFSDIAPAQFSKYLPFSNFDLYFRFFPLLTSILLGAAAYCLGKKMTGSSLVGLWSIIFTLFCGSFGYIVTWIQNKTIGGESIFYATQIQSSSGNPPQIISNIAVLTFFYLLFIYLQKKSWPAFISLVLILGTLVEFKVYAAVVLFIALLIACVYQIIKERKLYLLLLLVTSSILAAILYFPNSRGSASFLIFEPWWYIRTMVVTPSRLNWLDMELRRQTFIAEGNWKRVIQLETTAFLIFFFGNLGLRLFGLWEFIKRVKSFGNYFNQIFLITIITSLILPLLFLQKGVASNTSQFLQYFILLLGILAAISTAEIISRVKYVLLKIIIAFFIILLAIPTQIGLIKDFYDSPPLSKITKDELTALQFLKNNSQKESILLTPPYNGYLDLKNKVPDIWDWSDSAYVSALASRRTYLSDSEQVDIMGYDLKSRSDIQKAIFEEVDPNEFIKKIKPTGAEILYFPIPQAPKVDLTKTALKQIFANEIVEIWMIP